METITSDESKPCGYFTGAKIPPGCQKLMRDVDDLLNAIAKMRAKLHAANRPMLRAGLREELRNDCDAALAKWHKTRAVPRAAPAGDSPVADTRALEELADKPIRTDLNEDRGSDGPILSWAF